jgi:MFS family permease
MGLFTGFFVVPLYTALQRSAPERERGRVIGANNFFNMVGVLLASSLLWVLRDGLGFSPASILSLVALLMLVATVSVLLRAPRLRTRLSLLAAATLVGMHRQLVLACVASHWRPGLARAWRAGRRA